MNTGSQALARAVSVALGAVTMAVVTRHLGAGGYGVLVAALAYTSIFTVLVDIGTGTVLVRELSGGGGSSRALLGKALGLRLALALAAMLVAAALLPLLYAGHTMRIAVLLVLPSILFGSVTSTLSVPLQAALRMRRFAVVDVAVQVVSAGSVLLLVASNRGLYSLLAAGVLASAAQAGLLALACRGIESGIGAPSVDLAAWRRLVVDALPLGIALVLNTLYFRIDTILLSVLRGPEATGVYGAAGRFLEISVSFASLLVLSLFPLLAAAAEVDDLERVRALARRGVELLVLAGAPLVAAVLVVAPELVRLATGSEFDAAVSPLRILIVAAAFMPVNALLGHLVIALRREARALWLNVLALVVNVALNVALIPAYGVVAAAWVFLASELVIFASGIWLAYRYARFTLPVALPLRAVAAGALMGAAMVAVGGRPAAALPAGASAYLLALWLLRAHARPLASASPT